MTKNFQAESITYFYGELVSGEALEETAVQRAKPYQEKKVILLDKKNQEDNGWVVKKEFEKNILMKKEKPIDEQLEDSVWLLFKNLGFNEMNKDGNFKIAAGSSQKQIDVFAKDENNVFIIFCTSQESLGPCASLKNKIHEVSDLKKDISDSITGKYKKKLRTTFMLVTRNIEWNETDEKLALEKQIFYWKDADLEACKIIADQLGHAAKYQIYSLLFGGKEASEVGEIKVPAMRGGTGREKYYCFLIPPKDLFKIAYVHRREKSNPQEIGSTYQRMVNKKRIEDIGKYIDGGHSFPNNIIIAFKPNIEKPHFNPHPKVEEISGISYGVLTFPSYYGCAWIIDGQHRLYGYSKSEHASDPHHTLSVIAFESLNVKKQANLFVDINEKQKAVNKNLLWDLYSDIYDGSEDEEQQILRTISLVAKKLNSDKDSVFYGHIKIPSILTKDKKTTNLTLTTICEAIKENKLIDEEENMLFKDDYEATIDYASERIKSFFETIINFFHEDWERGDNGLIRSNVGMRIIFNIFRQLLRDLNYKGNSSVYKKRDLSEFRGITLKRLQPVLDKLKAMDNHKLNEIRQASNKKLVMLNSQKLLWEMYQNDNFGAELWFKGGWTPGAPDDDNKIEKLVDDTEIKLRALIIQKLKEKYVESWYKQGIPGGVKDKIKEVSEKDSSLLPWMRENFDSLSPEEKLNLALTSHMREIIINEGNWNLFINIFAKDKECTSVQFRFFESLRNKYKHHRELDDVGKGLGYYGMRWIRKCLGIDDLKDRKIKTFN
jgi:DGQHR domain-containing protein